MKERNTPAIQRIHHPAHAPWLLTLTLVFAASVFLFFQPWRGDGIAPVFHCAQIATLLMDRTLDASAANLMASNPLDVTASALSCVTAKGYISGRYPIGPTLLFAPFWIMAHLLDVWFRSPVRCNPFAAVYLFAASFSSLFYGYLGFLLTWRTATRFVSPRLACLCTIIAFFGTAGIPACFKLSGHTSVYAYFACALFAYAACESIRFWNWRTAGYLGLTLGLLTITCWPAFIFLGLPLAGLIQSLAVRRRKAPFPDTAADMPAGMEDSEKNAAIRGEAEPSGVSDAAALSGDAGGLSGVADNQVVVMDDGLPDTEPDIPPPPAALAREVALKKLALEVFFGVGIFLLVLSPQILVWRKLFGKFVLFPGFKYTMYDGLPLPDHSFLMNWRHLWTDALFAPGDGFFFLYPTAAAACVGLLVMALRAGLLGMVMLALPLLFTVLDCAPWQWQKPEPVSSARFFLLTPFLAIGLAFFLNETRLRLVRYPLALALVLLTVWNVALTVALRPSIPDISPWGGTQYLWRCLPALLSHPLSFFCDSILVRYLTQGTPPVEALMSLLFTVLVIPSFTWALVHYILPPIRQWSLLKAFALTLFVFLIFFDALVIQSETPSKALTGHLALRKAASVEDLRRLHEKYPASSVISFHLAFTLMRHDKPAAFALFQELADQNYRAGWQGVLETAPSNEERVRALARLTRSELCGVSQVLQYFDCYRVLGMEERARDYLDRAFPPPYPYWICRSRIAKDAEEKAKCLRAAAEHRLEY